MELTIQGLKRAQDYTNAGIITPTFDVEAMQENGKKDPRWVHIGPGNIFRIFIAGIAHSMLEAGHNWPITAVVPMDPAELDIQLAAHDLMTLGITLNPDGTRHLETIAGIAEGLATAREKDFQRFINISRQQRTTLLSFTITEKGYSIHDSSGDLSEATKQAINSDPRGYQGHTMALIATFLLHRYEAGAFPITLLSCDNFSHNGDKLRSSILTIAQGWAERGTVPENFITWLSDPTQVGFPISVIDKITPRPNAEIAEELSRMGFTDMNLTMLGRTPLAGFVNAEPTQYLIIEDAFAAERPPLEKFGVQLVDRTTCDEFEHMKVTTCLNPLHTALALAGCLLRFPTIDSEMRDPDLAAFVHKLAWKEGLPVVVDPGIVNPSDFLKEVEETRFPNPYLPDDPARIATDTSQKLPIRFGETIKRYIERGLDLNTLEAIPLVYALWCRYLMGIADDGEPFLISPDPLAQELQAHLAHIKLGEETDVHAALYPILSNAEIFGIDLYSTPLAATTESLFARLIAHPGAVREVLNKENH